MKIYTMGFTQKTAEQFFDKINQAEIEILIDVRLNNQSQLAAFTKGTDLAYFLKTISHCAYSHEISFAPTKELLSSYKKGEITWDQYVLVFQNLIEKRKMVDYFSKHYAGYDRVLLLCSEPTPEKCHRRLLAEAFRNELGCEIEHL